MNLNRGTVACLVLFAAAGGASAQGTPGSAGSLPMAAIDASLSASQMQTSAAQAAGWTDADYAKARTPSLRASYLAPSAFDFNGAVEMANSMQIAGGSAGGRGGADATGMLERRQYSTLLSSGDDGAIGPQAVGTGGIHFTSTRTYPNSSDTTYPTRTVGKLYFKKPDGSSWMCSGSMIKPGVVVTAGHCVHSGNGSASGWYNSFQFIPGYRKVGSVETRPYGTWSNWAHVRTSTSWFSGGGTVPNQRDFAVIVFNKNGSGLNIGNYTGWLGWIYPRMIGRHNTVLGYPGNLDLGGQMHRVESMVNNGGTNNGIFGSDMEGGSSGGPVVLNFRSDYANSSSLPSENEGNRVTSVVSWGYISTAPKIQGGSQFDSVFSTMLNNACAVVPGAC